MSFHYLENKLNKKGLINNFICFILSYLIYISYACLFWEKNDVKRERVQKGTGKLDTLHLEWANKKGKRTNHVEPTAKTLYGEPWKAKLCVQLLDANWWLSTFEKLVGIAVASKLVLMEILTLFFLMQIEFGWEATWKQLNIFV